jgi:hypothetical protein
VDMLPQCRELVAIRRDVGRRAIGLGSLLHECPASLRCGG